MEKLIVYGGRRLNGDLEISTAKNSLLPILAGSILNGSKLLLKKVCKLSPIPVIAGGLISDKEDVMNILKSGVISVSSTNENMWFI